MGGLIPFPGGAGEPNEQAQVVDAKGQLRKQYRPSLKTKASWKREGERREDPGYAARWTAFWGRVVRAIAAIGSVGTVEMHWVEEYVLRCRLSELHYYEAAQDPYQTYESGYIAAHPGFAQSRAESKLARALGRDLGFSPVALRAAGVESTSAATQGWVDDQAGL